MSTEHEKELNRKRQAAWREKNPARALAQGREKSKRYQLAHPQRVRSFQRRWRLERAMQKSKELIARLPDTCQPSKLEQPNLAFEDAAGDSRRDVFGSTAKTRAPDAVGKA